MSEDQISPNRNRFYPEIEWADLSHEQKLIKDATVEMFLKTLELISTFHPYLSSGQLLEVERKMAITKKTPFEKWVTKSFAKKTRSTTPSDRLCLYNCLIETQNLLVKCGVGREKLDDMTLAEVADVATTGNYEKNT